MNEEEKLTPGTGVWKERRRLEKARELVPFISEANAEAAKLVPCRHCGHPKSAHSIHRYGVDQNGHRIRSPACQACDYPGTHRFKADSD